MSGKSLFEQALILTWELNPRDGDSGRNNDAWLPVLFQLAHKSLRTAKVIHLSLDQINHEVTVLRIENIIAPSTIAYSRQGKWQFRFM